MVHSDNSHSLNTGTIPATVMATAAGLLPIVALVLAMPLVHLPVILSLGAIAGAGVAAAIAFAARADRDPRGVGAWDIAGFLAFVGFGAGMLVGADDMLKFIGLS